MITRLPLREHVEVEVVLDRQRQVLLEVVHHRRIFCGRSVGPWALAGAMGMAKKELEAPIFAAAVAVVVLTTVASAGEAAAGAAAAAAAAGFQL